MERFSKRDQEDDPICGFRLFYYDKACGLSYQQHRNLELCHELRKTSQANRLYRLLIKENGVQRVKDIFCRGSVTEDTKPSLCAAIDFLRDFTEYLSYQDVAEAMQLPQEQRMDFEEKTQKLLAKARTNMLLLLQKVINPYDVIIVLARDAIDDDIIQLDSKKQVIRFCYIQLAMEMFNTIFGVSFPRSLILPELVFCTDDQGLKGLFWLTLAISVFLSGRNSQCYSQMWSTVFAGHRWTNSYPGTAL